MLSAKLEESTVGGGSDTDSMAGTSLKPDVDDTEASISPRSDSMDGEYEGLPAPWTAIEEAAVDTRLSGRVCPSAR
jgi:hypothetical protein